MYLIKEDVLPNAKQFTTYFCLEKNVAERVKKFFSRSLENVWFS